MTCLFSRWFLQLHYQRLAGGKLNSLDLPCCLHYWPWNLLIHITFCSFPFPSHQVAHVSSYPSRATTCCEPRDLHTWCYSQTSSVQGSSLSLPSIFQHLIPRLYQSYPYFDHFYLEEDEIHKPSLLGHAAVAWEHTWLLLGVIVPKSTQCLAI